MHVGHHGLFELPLLNRSAFSVSLAGDQDAGVGDYSVSSLLGPKIDL